MATSPGRYGKEMGTGTNLGLPRRTRCFDGIARRGPAARRPLLRRPSALEKRAVLGVRGRGAGEPPSSRVGQRWWEGEARGRSWARRNTQAGYGAPRPGAGTCAGRRRTLTSQERGARRPSRSSCLASNPRLLIWLQLRLYVQLRGLDAEAGAEEARRTRPRLPSLREPIGAWSHSARALEGAGTLIHPVGPRRPGTPRPPPPGLVTPLLWLQPCAGYIPGLAALRINPTA